MADQKITDLTEDTAPAATDLLVTVDNPGGSPVNKKVTVANLGEAINPMTTAGDVIYGGASGVLTRLAIGTANQLLRTNSGATAPEWASVGRVLISEQTPSSTGTVTFDNIPATYKHLLIEYVGRSTASWANL